MYLSHCGQFGYKSKDLRHPVRKPEPAMIEEPPTKEAKSAKPAKDFIKKNREQFRPQRFDRESRDNRSDKNSTEIKPGTVTLTQEQLNALLTTVGKLKLGEANALRISIGEIFLLIAMLYMIK